MNFEGPSKPTAKELAEIGMRVAQERAKTEGLKIGGIVSHPDIEELRAYELVEINGDMATIRLPAEYSTMGKEIIREVSTEGLFDPEVARKVALNYYIENPSPTDSVN